MKTELKAIVSLLQEWVRGCVGLSIVLWKGVGEIGGRMESAGGAARELVAEVERVKGVEAGFAERIGALERSVQERDGKLLEKEKLVRELEERAGRLG